MNVVGFFQSDFLTADMGSYFMLQDFSLMIWLLLHVDIVKLDCYGLPLLHQLLMVFSLC